MCEPNLFWNAYINTMRELTWVQPAKVLILNPFYALRLSNTRVNALMLLMLLWQYVSNGLPRVTTSWSVQWTGVVVLQVGRSVLLLDNNSFSLQDARQLDTAGILLSAMQTWISGAEQLFPRVAARTLTAAAAAEHVLVVVVAAAAGCCCCSRRHSLLQPTADVGLYSPASRPR